MVSRAKQARPPIRYRDANFGRFRDTLSKSFMGETEERPPRTCRRGEGGIWMRVLSGHNTWVCSEQHVCCTTILCAIRIKAWSVHTSFVYS